MGIHPQTKAEIIGKYACLAMCYLYCIGIEDENEYIRIVTRVMDKGLLDDECTVLDAPKLLQYVSGDKYSVIKKDITPEDLIYMTSPTPVRYDYKGHSHWVVVENGRIVFNSLKESNCVKNGMPTTARILVKGK